MEKLKILIADTNTEFTDSVQRCLRLYDDMELISIEHDGRDALKRIRDERPDGVIFDLLLPGLDGISLLRAINSMPDPPASICCTRFCTEVAMEALRAYRASYLMYKPIEINALHPILISCIEMQRRIHQLKRAAIADDSDSAQQNAFIRNYIISLGVPGKLAGCSYLAEAVRIARTDSSLMKNLSKGLYLEIARSMNTTPERIERCIRSAIDAAYQHGELRMQLPERPSSKAFISYILKNLLDHA